MDSAAAAGDGPASMHAQYVTRNAGAQITLPLSMMSLEKYSKGNDKSKRAAAPQFKIVPASGS
jgi:hypothetical protein